MPNILKSGREKTVLKQGLIIMGILGGIYIFLINPFLKEGGAIIDEELDKKTMEIKRYITLTGSLPSKEGFNKLDIQGKALEKAYTELVDFIDPKSKLSLEPNQEAGLYFIERLHSVVKKFETDTNSKGTKLPENLGFGDGMPKDNMVDIFLRQLDTMEYVIGSLLKNDIVEINTLKPLKAIEYTDPMTKELFYSELPIQISMKVNSQGLAGFLFELKNAKPVIAVKEVHIKNNEDNLILDATLVLSSFKEKNSDSSVVKSSRRKD
jgi:hypothetical protein